MADISKFKNGQRLWGKRSACRPLDDNVRQLASKNPKRFNALIMPSVTMHDVDLLEAAGVPYDNMRVIERDRESFHEIRNDLLRRGMLSDTVTTKQPMRLGRRIAMLDGPFDWMNLDMCGPIYGELFQCVDCLASRCFRADSCLQITVKCARESAEEQKLQKQLNDSVRHIGIGPARDNMERRLIALFALMTIVPLRRGWVPYHYIPVWYREDRANGRTGIPMLCHAVVYRPKGSDNTRRLTGRLMNIWKNQVKGIRP